MIRFQLFFIILAFFGFLVSCNQFDVAESRRFEKSVTGHSLQTKSTESELFYDPDLGLYLVRNDLSLFEACDNPTHAYVALYPRNTEELFRLKNISGISFSYIPFEYRPIHCTESCSVIDTVLSKSPYSVRYSNQLESGALSDSTRSQTSTEIVSPMPVLYAIWPLERDFPDWVEYTVKSMVSIPDHASDNAYDRSEQPQFGTLPLCVRTYDSLLVSYLPMKHMKVHISFGLASSDYYTNNNGFVYIDPYLYTVQSQEDLGNVSVTLVYESPKWIISPNISNLPMLHYVGTVNQLWGIVPLRSQTVFTHYENLSSLTSECEIHRAVDYYHNELHDYSSFIISSEQGKIIHALDSLHAIARAETKPHPIFDPTIFVYSNQTSQQNHIGDVLHELGHVHHYYKKGAYVPFSNVSRFVRESYASFVGWILSESYYLSKGYIKPSSDSHINDQGRQNWTSLSDNYSPFFVDLVDTFSQTAITDTIQGVSVFCIEEMADTCSSIGSCKQFLSAMVGTEFTLDQYNIQMSYY